MKEEQVNRIMVWMRHLKSSDILQKKGPTYRIVEEENADPSKEWWLANERLHDNPHCPMELKGDNHTMKEITVTSQIHVL